MNLAQLLVRSGQSQRERPAVVVGTECFLNYGELAHRTAVLAGRLRQLGLQTSDRMALIMKNSPQYIELLFAGWHAGLVVVPINAKLHPREFEYILDHSGTKVCFVTAELDAAISPLRQSVKTLQQVIPVESVDYAALLQGEPLAITERADDDTAWLFYTSGTTGQPKGAMLTQRNLLTMTWCYFADVDPVSPDDCLLHAAPMSHGSGIYILPHVAQGASNIIPPSGGFDPAEIFDLIPHHPGLSMFAAPTMVKRLTEHPQAANADTRNLKTIVYGGGPMYQADLARAQAVFGNKLVQIYGQGESPMTISALNKSHHADSQHPRHRARLSSVGIAFTGLEVRVADSQDKPLPAGETGEILVRGDSVMAGYWQRPDASTETLRNGWLHTGDLGRLDTDGFLSLTDRSKDLIISGGSNIYPREIEEILLQHPTVSEVGVIGAPDPDWGEKVIAFVVPQAEQSLDQADLDAFLLERIARFKRPKEYHFVESLPKNNYGKILKTELRRCM